MYSTPDDIAGSIETPIQNSWIIHYTITGRQRKPYKGYSSAIAAPSVDVAIEKFNEWMSTQFLDDVSWEPTVAVCNETGEIVNLR